MPRAQTNNLPGRRLATLLLLVTALGLMPQLHAETDAKDDGDTRPPAYQFLPGPNPAASIGTALANARSANKLALIALGAEWCHDSRAFGERLAEPAMQAVLERGYVVQFIDLGYLEDSRKLMAPLGYPINFGTPTVLVMDPHTGTLLNYESVSTWQNAYLVPPEDYEQQFSMLFDAWRDGLIEPDKYAPSNTLADYEARQVDRLAAAYAQLGPLLAAYDAGELENPDTFETLWNEVRDFRAALQRELLVMRNTERLTGELPSSLPEFGPFSWE